MFNSAKDRVANMLNAATVSGFSGILRENMAREVQHVIDQQVRPLLLKRVREGQLSSTDVADVCQSTAAAFIVAAEKKKIQPATDSREYDAQVVGRYLHGIALHKLADLRRQLGFVPVSHYAVLQQLTQELNDSLRSAAASATDPSPASKAGEQRMVDLLKVYLANSALVSTGEAAADSSAAQEQIITALLARLRQGRLKPRRTDFGLITPEAVSELLAALAEEAGLRLQPRTRKPDDLLRPAAGPAALADSSFIEIADTRDSEAQADERLWQQLREAGRRCSSQDVVVAYLSFAGASHKSIARRCGIHINTVTNCVRRVVEELRRILMTAEQGVR